MTSLNGFAQFQSSPILSANSNDAGRLFFEKKTKKKKDRRTGLTEVGPVSQKP